MSILGDILGFQSAGRSAKSISDANIAAEHGVLDATSTGQTNIQNSISSTAGNLGTALDNANTANNGQQAYNSANVNKSLNDATAGVNAAGAGINTATTQANSSLQGLLDQTQANYAPGIASGAQGNKSLQDYAASNPQFKFSYDDYKNDPAYQFQMQQGTNAITNQASAQGLSQGGSTLAALTQYGQGLAATHYNDAFNRAQSQFQTNQNTTLANLNSLISSGNTANAGSSQAAQAFGGQQASNTIGAAGANASLQEFLGNLNTSGQQSIASGAQQNQQYLGSLNAGSLLAQGAQSLQGNEAAAQLGLSGAKTAGDFATGAGVAHAAGITGQAAALTNGFSDLAGLIQGIPGLGGKA